jgi:hypothetical protein
MTRADYADAIRRLAREFEAERRADVKESK